MSRISNLYMPRTIQEAFDDLNWRLAVIEEMNALSKTNMWIIINLP